jgi:surface protein
MFDGCSSLESLDVSTFRTTSAQYIDYMFNDCSSLTSLDLSNFDMKSLSLTDTRGYPSSTFTTFHLLDGCTALKEIEVPTHLNSSISNALPSDFYKTGSDGKADLAAGVFTALPTGLETSISLVRSDEISSGVEGAVSIAVPSGKIAVRVYAENGEVLAGADVGITKADGTSAGEGNTDDTGSFFCETSGKVKISVTKNGYFSKLVTRTLSTGTATCITLLSKSAHSYSCCSIMLDNEIDIQSEKKAIRRVDGGVLDNQIVVNIEKADTAADISSYALLQDGKVITNSSSNTLTVNLEASDQDRSRKEDFGMCI